VPLGAAKLHLNRCNESPPQSENADFRPLSKFNTGSLTLRGKSYRQREKSAYSNLTDDDDDDDDDNKNNGDDRKN